MIASKALTRKQHTLLVEALRRHTRFNLHDLREPLDRARTGLGSATTYAPAVKAGLMECATTLNPRYSTWWRLTPKGAAIVQGWLFDGYDYEAIERGDVPPMHRANSPTKEPQP